MAVAIKGRFQLNSDCLPDIMANLFERPIPTIELSSPAEFRPRDGSVYVFGSREEERTEHLAQWSGHAQNVEVIHIVEQEREHIRLAGRDDQIPLRNKDVISQLLTNSAPAGLYLDITGLSNQIWPALLRTALEDGIATTVLYVEPLDYAYSSSPRENEIFDLSDRIMGIAPIPQFTNLTEPDEDKVRLVPLLGFEGARFAHLIEEIQPPGNNIDPIIGVPGFRAEYPFFAYQGNQIPLRASKSYRNVRFAKANCPFSLFYTLREIRRECGPDPFLKVGLIGTKPHALGAVLFALISPSQVELVYDHTKRKPERTTGHSRCLIYPVSEFFGYPRLAS